MAIGISFYYSFLGGSIPRYLIYAMPKVKEGYRALASLFMGLFVGVIVITLSNP